MCQVYQRITALARVDGVEDLVVQHHVVTRFGGAFDRRVRLQVEVPVSWIGNEAVDHSSGLRISGLDIGEPLVSRLWVEASVVPSSQTVSKIALLGQEHRQRALD